LTLLSGNVAKAAPRRIVIASRESTLAMWQARHVQSRLAGLYPRAEITVLGLTTEGDRRLDLSLAKMGGKGLFVKELEDALAAGRADLAVHSMKDVPMHLPAGFALAAVMEREDPRDAFVSHRYPALAALPAGGRVGTSSLRRECQIRAHYSRLEVRPLRGNVTTRLRKLDEDAFDAILLAVAGLKRLGLERRVTALLEPEESLPAPGQGALGLECRTGRADLLALLEPLAHRDTMLCVTAERAVSRALSGSCNVPLGAYAQLSGTQLRLRAFIGAPDGSRIIAGERAGGATDAEAIGIGLAEELRSRGADAILAELEKQAADERR
jgi:hydroxymethylbilane synthase